MVVLIVPEPSDSCFPSNQVHLVSFFLLTGIQNSGSVTFRSGFIRSGFIDNSNPWIEHFFIASEKLAKIYKFAFMDPKIT